MATDLLFSFEHTPSQAEFELFARISGDDNPIHVDAAFAARSRFGRPVAHGMMLYALIWRGVRDAMPGAAIVEQSLKFPNPSYAGERLVIEGVLERDAGRDCIIATARRSATGEPVCEARCVIGGRAAA